MPRNDYAHVPKGTTSVRLMVHFSNFWGAKSLRSHSLPRTPYDTLSSQPGIVYKMPYQRAAMLKEYWPVRYAAKKWGCSYRAARLWMLRHPEHVVCILIQSPTAERCRQILAVKAGTQKVSALSGNPKFLDPKWQRDSKELYWLREKRRRWINW